MRILLIEDDIKLCDFLKFQLDKEGFSVDISNDGEDGLHFASQLAYDLILLDRMIPGMNGLQVLKSIRKSSIPTPVIFITALGDLNDKIIGLDAGADDYIVKPFAFEELMARIRSINRRPRQWENVKRLTFGDISYDSIEKTLYGPHTSCSLSKREGNLMEIFLYNTNQTLPRIVLLSKVWGPDAEVEEGNLDNYIHFLRRRLKHVESTLTLKTIRGVGYRLEDSDV